MKDFTSTFIKNTSIDCIVGLPIPTSHSLSFQLCCLFSGWFCCARLAGSLLWNIYFLCICPSWNVNGNGFLLSPRWYRFAQYRVPEPITTRARPQEDVWFLLSPLQCCLDWACSARHLTTLTRCIPCPIWGSPWTSPNCFRLTFSTFCASKMYWRVPLSLLIEF